MEENRRRNKQEPEYELTDTGVFADGRYFDVFVEYAKGTPDDLLISITAVNRGPQQSVLHLLPTLWFRNTWIWGCAHEGCWMKPLIRLARGQHAADGAHYAGPLPSGRRHGVGRQRI